MSNAMTNIKPMKLLNLTCSCCGSSTEGRQWHNRDEGYGLCPKCADWMIGRGESNEVMQSNYGSNGIHWVDSSSEFIKGKNYVN
jgi:Zn-finger nucleic acid-binding protein